MAKWNYAKIGDVCTVERGGSPRPIDKFITNAPDGINWIKIGDTTDSMYITETAQKIIPEGMKKSRYVQPGDFLLSNSMSFGRPYILKIDGCIHDGWLVLRDDSGVFDKRFLYYYLSSPSTYQKFKNMAVGGVVNNLNSEMVRGVTVPIPEMKEQIEIVETLDSVSNLISLRKQQLAKLDELVKARFVELFGETGKQVPLTDYVWFQEGPGVRSVDFTDEGTILLTGSNINDNTISFGHKSDRHISNELASGKYAHFMCDKDDILVVSSAIDPDKFDKKVVVVDVDKKYCLNTGIIRFKPNKQYLTLGYFREFLKTDYFKHQVSSEMRGIAQMHFGPSHLKQMTILLPDSIERQVEFEAFVQQTDKSKLAIQQSLDKLETLKKSLMQKYFG
jgi:type I restriction enzyme S subunit